MRIIIGISGSSGVVYGIRLLQLLQQQADVETHLIMSATAKMNVPIETDMTVAEVEALADVQHHFNDVAASVSSGSFVTAGMIVAPCSMKTLSGIVNSYADNLLVRAADVVLKEGRKLVLMPRESPLHLGHCRLLYQAARMGIQLAPPIPAFYNRPGSVEDVVDHSVGRVLDLFSLDAGVVKRWEGKGGVDPER
ncbi:MAG: UbiX family flavin prenyltransferase [Gammaproteobacteria bacterium]